MENELPKDMDLKRYPLVNNKVSLKYLTRNLKPDQYITLCKEVKAADVGIPEPQEGFRGVVFEFGNNLHVSPRYVVENGKLCYINIFVMVRGVCTLVRQHVCYEKDYLDRMRYVLTHAVENEALCMDHAYETLLSDE